MKDIQIKAVGDSGILLNFGNEIKPEINAAISAVVSQIKVNQVEGVIDMVPAFCSLLVNYDPRIINYDEISSRLLSFANTEITEENNNKIVYEIPVCYDRDLGPDMETVMAHSKLSEEEVIKLHTSKDYLIYMLGFLPGFTYLGGLDEVLHTPRLANPRLTIPAGSVGIGGSQTGIYPLDSPGGWQLIGQTPIKSYDPMRTPPIIFEAGNYIRFVSISREEYDSIKEEVINGTYSFKIRKGGDA